MTGARAARRAARIRSWRTSPTSTRSGTRTSVPCCSRKYPGTSAAALREARAYAYGGSTIQDLGYFPFGSKFFTNLLHYVKTGDFVEAMMRDAHDVNELAFAIGALCHYASDTEGHAIAVNRAVPLMYPKLRAKYGDTVPYDKAPKQHVIVEFAFDVLLVAHGGYKLQAYHDFIGFKVAKPLLERAFQKTYGLEMKDLFLSEDLAIGTYRRAVASTIPNVTKVAWEKKQDEIQKTTPGVAPGAIRADAAARGLRAGIRQGLPEARHLRAHHRRALRDPAEDRPVPSAGVQGSAARSRTAVSREPDPHAGPLRGRRWSRCAPAASNLPNVDFDTGKPSAPGEYPLADKTHAGAEKRTRK